MPSTPCCAKHWRQLTGQIRAILSDESLDDAERQVRFARQAQQRWTYVERRERFQKAKAGAGR